MTATALYLYCVVPATDPMPALSSPALDGGPVRAVRYQELAALAHVCPPEPYQGSDEEVRGWVAVHNAVVEEVTSVAIDAQAAEAPARGRAYFARQQLRRQLRERLEPKAEEDARRYLENLAALAEDVQVNKPRPVKGRQMVLNLSLLVARAAVSRVGEYLEEVSREPGVEVRFTGPWPPYSFAGTFGTIGDGEPSPMAERGRSTTGGA